jgi:hypothetical protein
MGNATL